MSKKYLLIINDAPYGNERPYNGLRLAVALLKNSDVVLRIFLFGDGVQCAVRDQKPPHGNYNVEHMLSSIIQRGAIAT